MAARKKKPAVRGKRKAPVPVNTDVKALSISIENAKYLGHEREWYDVKLTDENRKVHLMKTLTWYSTNFGAKEAKQFIVDYLYINDRKADSKKFKKVADYSFPQGIGWLARMSHMGWELSKVELQKLTETIDAALASVVKTTEPDAAEEKKSNQPNIQERMREKAHETTGELEGLLDDYVAGGAKARHSFEPLVVLKEANILPAHVNDEVAYWETRLKELTAAYKGDKELKEGYGHFTKIQLRNIVKFVEQIIADYHSYVAYKKAAKAPRKVKPKTPEQLTRKLKYMKECSELNLKSMAPTKIIGAREMFAYHTKKRKLMYFVADEYAGGLTVRNNMIEGFDSNKTKQKTVRKPAEQLKEFMAASLPNSRKIYKNTKGVETKVSNRFADEIIILRVK